MSDKAQQEEPSMEEILASIRRIIADDGEPAEERDEHRPQDEPVLELTQRVDEHGVPVAASLRPEPAMTLAPAVAPPSPARVEPALPPPPAPPPVPPEPVQAGPKPRGPTAIAAPAQAEVDRLLAEESRRAPPVAAPPAEAEADRLMSEESGTASARAFAEIATFTRARREMLMGNGERTLEDLTRELLRPLLKDWLDQNLPGLVQRLVKEEIERVVREGTSA